MRTRDWKQVRLIHSNLWDWVQQGASFDETNVKMCQVQWMNEEQKLQWPKLRCLGLHWKFHVGITVSAVWKKKLRLYQVEGRWFCISKICGEYRWDTFTVFSLNGGTWPYRLRFFWWGNRLVASSLKTNYLARDPSSLPKLQERPGFGVQMMFSYAGPSTTWRLHHPVVEKHGCLSMV